ncbi:hypothetical protein HDU86_000983 [Geranomyces michiganensis]|nr:hypothetical protein HDU86_000983 [Geranomyces michiganensis]
MNNLAAGASATRTHAEGVPFTIRPHEKPDAGRSSARRKRIIWAAGLLSVLVLIIAGVSAGVAVSLRKTETSSTPSSTVTSTPAVSTSSSIAAPTTVARKEWVMLGGYDIANGKDMAVSSIPQQNMSLCGTTCGEVSNCVAGVWNGGSCYLKSVVESLSPNVYCYAYFQKNTSYTGWRQTAGQTVPAFTFASYNVSAVECGSVCAAYRLCMGFEMFDTPNPANPSCVLKLVGTGLSAKPGATFYAKP